MKIINSKSSTFDGNIIDYYEFDKLSTLDDVLLILSELEKAKFILDGLYVSEFGDYDSGKLIRTYKKDEISKIKEDFYDKIIELYSLMGTINEHNVVASIDPIHNKLKLDYNPNSKQQLDDMFAELSEKNDKVIDNSKKIN